MFDEAAAGADVVLGSRFSRSSVLINYPLQKILCNRLFHLLLHVVFRRKMRDVTNNLKLLRREVVKSLDLESAWFAANAETGLKPILMGYDVRPVAISWINRTPEMGVSSFSLINNGLGYVKILASLAWRSRFGTDRFPDSLRRKPTPSRYVQGLWEVGAGPSLAPSQTGRLEPERAGQLRPSVRVRSRGLNAFAGPGLSAPISRPW